MANEQLPDRGIFEGEPPEYRIILRRGARTEEVQDLESLLTEPSEDDEPEVFWEGTVEDLETANLWEAANLVPTIESDWYELQQKLDDGEFLPVATFSSQDDYDDAIKKATNPPPELLVPEGERES